MKLAKAGIIALVMTAGLVATVPFANAQGNQAATQGPDQNLAAKLTDFKSKSAAVMKDSSAYLQFTQEKDHVRKLVPGPQAAATRKTVEGELQNAIQRRDEAANQLAAAIDSAMKMSVNNEKLGKQLQAVYDEMQTINKTTSYALLAHDEALAVLDERAAADSRAAAAVAPEQ